MITLRPRISHLFIVLLAVTVLPAPRCSRSSSNDGVSGRSGSSRNIRVVPGSGSTWATGTLPQSAAPVPSEFINLVNSFRTARGLSPLIYHDGLSLGLQRHQDDMTQFNYFGLVNPENGIDVPIRLVSSSPRIDFDNVSHFILRNTIAPNDAAAWNVLINDPFFRETILDPAATHIGGYKQGHFQTIIGYNVIPSSFAPGATPPPVPPPTPPATTSGGGGGGGSFVTIRFIRI